MVLYAQRSNRVCQIEESEVQKYLNLGYTIMDEQGTRLYEELSDDVDTLKELCQKQADEIKSLKSQIEQLKTKAIETEANVTDTAEDVAEVKKPRKSRAKVVAE